MKKISDKNGKILKNIIPENEKGRIINVKTGTIIRPVKRPKKGKLEKRKRTIGAVPKFAKILVLKRSKKNLLMLSKIDFSSFLKSGNKEKPMRIEKTAEKERIKPGSKIEQGLNKVIKNPHENKRFKGSVLLFMKKPATAKNKRIKALFVDGRNPETRQYDKEAVRASISAVFLKYPPSVKMTEKDNKYLAI